jgi:hypothetical protein
MKQVIESQFKKNDGNSLTYIFNTITRDEFRMQSGFEGKIIPFQVYPKIGPALYGLKGTDLEKIEKLNADLWLLYDVW